MGEHRRSDIDDAVATDGALLARCADDPQLFAVFYRRHVDAVLAYFMRRTGDAQTAADLCSETFAAAFGARRRFKDTGRPARAWLFGIARRQLGSFARRQRVSVRHRHLMGMHAVEELSATEIERIETLADLAPLRSSVADAMRQLPASQADAVRLRVVDDLSYDTIATRLGVSEGAARVRVSRGLTRLADLLETTS